MRISDWISDVCSSDLASQVCRPEFSRLRSLVIVRHPCWSTCRDKSRIRAMGFQCRNSRQDVLPRLSCIRGRQDSKGSATISGIAPRSEEHTSELQSLMRNSYAVFCLNTKTNKNTKQ